MKTHKKKIETKKAKTASVRVTYASVEARDVAVADVLPNPFQPREVYPEADIEELARSIAQVGMFQPIVVRPAEDGKYELVAGQRRLLAAERVGLKTVLAECGPFSDAAARAIALTENVQRKDLSAIEKARAMQRMLDEKDVASQTELAVRLGVEPTTVSNLLRLLNLPERWQKRIISREITERHGRAVLPLVGHPAILDALEQVLAEEIDRAGDAPTVADWEREFIPDTVHRFARSMTGNMGQVWDHKRGTLVSIFTPTAKQKKELGLLTVGGETFATNTELWDRLQREHVGMQAENEGSGDDQGESLNKSGLDWTDENGEAAGYLNEKGRTIAKITRQRSASEDFAARLWEWKTNALRKAVSGYLLNQAGEAEIMKIMLLALRLWDWPGTGLHDGSELAALLKTAVDRHGQKKRRGVDVCADTMAVHDYDLTKIAAIIVARYFWDDLAGPNVTVPDRDVVTIAEALGIDMSVEWNGGTIAAPEAYWELHTREQLAAIAKEVRLHEWTNPMIPAKDISSLDRASLLKILMDCMTKLDDECAGIPCPKEILRAKLPK